MPQRLQCAAPKEAQQLADVLEEFIRTQFKVSDTDTLFSRTVHLFEEGYVDSIGSIELINFIESTFNLDLPESIMFNEDFTSIDGICRCLDSVMPVSPQSFCIEHNTFDSGILADKVGEVKIFDCDSIDEGLETEILAQIQTENFDYAFIKAPRRLRFEHFDFMGELNDLEADIGSVDDKLATFSKKVDVSAFDPSQWDRLESLLKYSSPTRYSRDPHISERTLDELKMELLKMYFNRNPELTRVAKNRDGEIIGFLNAYLKNTDSTLFFYEIVIHPNYRRGFVAINLFQSVLQKARRMEGNLNRVETGVYVDNVTSLSMFKILGLSPFASHYFYHYWKSHD